MATPPDWPTHLDPHVGRRIHDAALVEGVGGADASWVPLIAAFLASRNPPKADRTRLLAVLLAHPPPVTGFEKRLSPGKAFVAAANAGLDLEAFGRAMLLLEPFKAARDAMKHIGSEAAFAALEEQRRFELRLSAAELPPGFSRMKALTRLGLLDTKKLRRSAHMGELATLPSPVALTLIFDGKCDRYSPPPVVFFPPKLSLFEDGQFGSLAFDSVGSPAELQLEDLAPLRTWSRLERLSLRHTTLASAPVEALATIRDHVPRVKQLVLSTLPPGDWRAAWPGLDLRIGRDERPAEAVPAVLEAT